MIPEADFIIVGGGTAGCVLANRLSASGRHKVVLIEAGGRRHSPWVTIPAGFQKLLVSERHNWRLVSDPDPGTGDRAIAVPRGRGLGGSSLINGMIWVRGQPADFDDWATDGCTGWDWANIEPYFRKVDGIGAKPNSPDTHPAIPVEEVRVRPDLATRFLDAAEQAGHVRNPNYNLGQQAGFAYYQVNQQGGRRVSAYHAYLEPALRRKNLQVLTDTQVERLAFTNGKISGVWFRRGPERHQITARREVILSAGAVHSPHILELSGIGDAKLLARLGIEPIADLPGVGENYVDHYCTRMSWRVTRPVTLNEATRGPRLVAAVLQYALTRRGILTFGTGLAGGFFSALSAPDRPDSQLFFMHASYGDASRRILDRSPGMTVGVSQLRPASRGAIHATSPDPRVPPSIRPNFLSDPHDVAVMTAAMRETRRIMETSDLAGLRGVELSPGADCRSDADWEGFARDTGQTIYHACGTCRMGTDERAVTDPELRLRGIPGLRVVDASVMPRIVSGNTQAAVYAIAERASDLVLRSAKPG